MINSPRFVISSFSNEQICCFLCFILYNEYVLVLDCLKTNPLGLSETVTNVTVSWHFSPQTKQWIKKNITVQCNPMWGLRSLLYSAQLQLVQSHRRSSVSFSDPELPNHFTCAFALYKSQQVSNNNNQPLPQSVSQSAGTTKTSPSSQCGLWVSGIKWFLNCSPIKQLLPQLRPGRQAEKSVNTCRRAEHPYHHHHHLHHHPSMETC